MVAVLVLSCGKTAPLPAISDPETTPTQISHNHKLLESKDGKRTYRFETPLLEKYDEAKEPYIEFKQGVKIETFSDDSTTVESDLVADYAHYNVTKKLWEGRGNVVARNLKEDKILYTEQLFWDEAQEKIYTDKPAKVIDRGNTHFGFGFEANQEFTEWQFNRARGRVEVENKKDSTAQDSTISAVDVVPGDSSASTSVAKIQPDTLQHRTDSSKKQ